MERIQISVFIKNQKLPREGKRTQEGLFPSRSTLTPASAVRDSEANRSGETPVNSLPE